MAGKLNTRKSLAQAKVANENAFNAAIDNIARGAEGYKPGQTFKLKGADNVDLEFEVGQERSIKFKGDQNGIGLKTVIDDFKIDIYFSNSRPNYDANITKGNTDILKKKLEDDGLSQALAGQIANQLEKQLINSPAVINAQKVTNATDIATKNSGVDKPKGAQTDLPPALQTNVQATTDNLTKVDENSTKTEVQSVLNEAKATVDAVNEASGGATKALVDAITDRASKEKTFSNRGIEDVPDPLLQLGKDAETIVGNDYQKGVLAKWRNMSIRKKGAAIFVALGIVGGGVALGEFLKKQDEEATQLALTELALQRQRETNGCFLYNSLTGEMKKISLLTCGEFDIGETLKTCATQSFNASSPTGILKCPDNTFNPCLKSSQSRSTDASIPLVPNACNNYLYKGDAPATVTGVTTRSTCSNKDVPCDELCKTENFNLPENYQLVCISIDFKTTLVGLATDLGYDPNKVFPPAGSSKKVSTTLMIIAGVVGLVFFALLWYYYSK